MAWNDTSGFWAVSRHADVMAVRPTRELFCSGKGILIFEIGAEYDSPPTMMHTDPPEHTRVPQARAARLRAVGASAPRARCARRATLLVDALEAGEAVDFVADRCGAVPALRSSATLLGMPDDDWHALLRVVGGGDPGRHRHDRRGPRAALQADMHEYLLATTGPGATTPGDDLISVLAPGRDRRRAPLSDAELAMFLIQLLVAGNETTRNMVSGGLVALAEQPGAVAAPRRRPVARAVGGRGDAALDHAVVASCAPRRVTSSVGGTRSRAGDPVLLLYASANRDERQFGPTADRFDVGRDAEPPRRLRLRRPLLHRRRRSPGSRHACCSTSSRPLRTVEPAGEVQRSNSSVIAGVKRAPLVFR